jgi:tripartite ATP-independent transporter DctP family solute receptor
MLLAAPAAYAQTVLTLAQVSVPEHPRARASGFFADTVKDKSKGRIVIDVVNRASLGDDTALVRALMDGILDISANSQGPVAAVVPEFNAFGMPFLFSTPEQAWRLLDGPLGDELARRAADKGLVVLGYWDNGIRQFSNSVRPIRVPADVAGLRIRTPRDAVSTDLIAALGATPVEIKFSDVYKALERGVIDGQENPLVNTHAARLHELQKYISLTGHKYEVTPFVMSRRSWDALSAEDQAILRDAAAEATRYQRQLTRQEDENALAALRKDGVHINTVDPRPFIAATAKIVDKWYASPIGDYVRRVVQAARAGE